MVFAPAVTLTVTIEEGRESHLHAGGQGFWVAQLMAELGVDVTMVAPLGGETGVVLSAIVAHAGIGLRSTTMATSNGMCIDERKDGRLAVIADLASAAPLTRHEVDDLYGATLVEGLDAGVCVLAGPGEAPVISAAIYERLAHDLGVNGRPGVADLSGEHLRRAIAGGIPVLKVSAEQLEDDGWLATDTDDAIVECAARLRDAGADTVVITRAERGVVVATGQGVSHVHSPRVQVVEPRGAGDSLTAGVAATLAQGGSIADGVRMGTAAGVLNVTRRGLGTGGRREIEDLAKSIDVRRIA